MNDGRWYPTQVLLADGRTVLMGGYGEAAPGHVMSTDVEVFTPGAGIGGIGSS